MNPNPNCSADRTAIHRPALSRPITLGLADAIISSAHSVFDYGCGRGGDVERLRQLGISASGWDPAFCPTAPREPADVVNLGYVLNVIEDPNDRAQALLDAWALTRQVLLVSARMEWEAKNLRAVAHRDGVVTTRGTFQRFYGQQELRNWIDETLGVRSIAASPGVFYVFRDTRQGETFLASRFRTRVAAPTARVGERLFDANRELLDTLIGFVANHGRLPGHGELDTLAELVERFGSVRRAFSLVKSVTGVDQWEAIRLERQRDLLVYIALGAFTKRPRFTDLPSNVQLDIKEFLGTYNRACAEADRLLFATGNREALDLGLQASIVGKLTSEALYVHVTALNHLPPIVRVYEGCARVLVGAVADVTLVKMRRDKPKISYLVYPSFDNEAHPALTESIIVDLRSLHVYRRDYREFTNPPILHRKETFVNEDYPGRARFAALTAQEERAGLLNETVSIGTRDGWDTLLQGSGFIVRGHRLVRVNRGGLVNEL